MAVLRAKAITAAFMYSDEQKIGSSDIQIGFVPRVQEHIEAAGEFGLAQDVDDAVELAEAISQVRTSVPLHQQCSSSACICTGVR